MDVADNILENVNAVQGGTELLDRPLIHPAFHAGNVLSDALEEVEQLLGAEKLADILDACLSGIEPSVRILNGRLRHAIWSFRQNVTPVEYRTRLTNRIRRLRGT